VSLVAFAITHPVAAQTLPPKPPLPTSSQLKAVPRTPPSPSAAGQPAPRPPAAPLVSTTLPVVSPVVAVPPAVTATAPAVAVADPNAIQWDLETKEYSAKVGEAEAKFTFWLTNVSSSEVLVNGVRTSCGCTVAKLPSQPWRIAPGSNGPIEVAVSLAGKSGLIAKGVTVDSSAGIKQLTVRVNIPGGAAPGSLPVQASGVMGDAERLKNMQLALADRQVVFKNAECAKCHADPAKGKTDGRLLYAAVCATCHNSHLRAAAVPDLRTLAHPTSADHWRTWITYGRAGSMMPAFAESEGGPLNPQQINALVDFMVKAFPNRPQAAQGPQPASTPPAAPQIATPPVPRPD
jgi:mono/diheme cytochrome c family protein